MIMKGYIMDIRSYSEGSTRALFIRFLRLFRITVLGNTSVGGHIQLGMGVGPLEIGCTFSHWDSPVSE